MKAKRTNQRLKVSKILNQNVLYIQNLKVDTILSSESKDADWISVEPIGFSMSVMIEKIDGRFEVHLQDEEMHTLMELSGMSGLSKEVKQAEFFVKTWLATQIIN
jgi:hypothetical protein